MQDIYNRTKLVMQDIYIRTKLVMQDINNRTKLVMQDIYIRTKLVMQDINNRTKLVMQDTGRLNTCAMATLPELNPVTSIDEVFAQISPRLTFLCLQILTIG